MVVGAWWVRVVGRGSRPVVGSDVRTREGRWVGKWRVEGSGDPSVWLRIRVVISKRPLLATTDVMKEEKPTMAGEAGGGGAGGRGGGDAGGGAETPGIKRPESSLGENAAHDLVGLKFPN